MPSHHFGLSNLLKEPEADQLLNITQRHLINLRNKGVVPYYRIGKSIRYSPEKLLSAVEVPAAVASLKEANLIRWERCFSAWRQNAPIRLLR